MGQIRVRFDSDGCQLVRSDEMGRLLREHAYEVQEQSYEALSGDASLNDTRFKDFPVIKMTITRHVKEVTQMGQELLFYNGPMPLTYDVYMKSWFPGPMPKGAFVFLMTFGDFHSVFSYSDDSKKQIGMPDDARTYDASKRLLAEAKMVKHGYFDHVHLRVEIAEIHYDGAGQTLFTATSVINEDGEKCSEREISGRKLRDYYFLWPVDLQP